MKVQKIHSRHSRNSIYGDRPSGCPDLGPQGCY